MKEPASERPADRPPAKTSAAARAKLRSPVDNQRAEFLRSCRARIQPEEVGLPRARRLRTGGLRREDVAALSGVSASWYTWLEQGRDIRVSDDVLERVSQTLRLSADERIYLFSLVQHRLPRLPVATHRQTPVDVERMLHALSVPAIAMNLRCDVLAWNAQNSAIYRDYGAIPPAQRNLLEILLTRPVSHMTPGQVEVMAQRLIGRLRFDYSKCADDPAFEALVNRLAATSPLFKRLWRTPDFTLHSYGVHRFTHSRFGVLEFEHTAYVPDGHPGIRVVICTPVNDKALDAIRCVNEEIRRSRLPVRAPDAPCPASCC